MIVKQNATTKLMRTADKLGVMDRYFAYGSNLDPAQMARRCPDSRFLCRADLPDYRLCYPRPSDTWGGGVAGVEAMPDAAVEGVVYEVSERDLAALDRCECIDAGHYTRRRVRVTAEDGRELEVWTYFAVPCPQGSPLPSRRYVDTILRGARHHRLSEGYLARLVATPICDG